MYEVYAFDKHGNCEWNFPLKQTSKGCAVAVERGTGNVLLLKGAFKAKCNAVVQINTNDEDVLLNFGERSLSDASDIAAAKDGRIFCPG